MNLTGKSKAALQCCSPFMCPHADVLGAQPSASTPSASGTQQLGAVLFQCLAAKQTKRPDSVLQLLLHYSPDELEISSVRGALLDIPAHANTSIVDACPFQECASTTTCRRFEHWHSRLLWWCGTFIWPCAAIAHL